MLALAPGSVYKSVTDKFTQSVNDSHCAVHSLAVLE